MTKRDELMRKVEEAERREVGMAREVCACSQSLCAFFYEQTCEYVICARYCVRMHVCSYACLYPYDGA